MREASTAARSIVERPGRLRTTGFSSVRTGFADSDWSDTALRAESEPATAEVFSAALPSDAVWSTVGFDVRRRRGFTGAAARFGVAASSGSTVRCAESACDSSASGAAEAAGAVSAGAAAVLREDARFVARAGLALGFAPDAASASWAARRVRRRGAGFSGASPDAADSSDPSVARESESACGSTGFLRGRPGRLFAGAGAAARGRLLEQRSLLRDRGLRRCYFVRDHALATFSQSLRNDSRPRSVRGC